MRSIQVFGKAFVIALALVSVLAFRGFAEDPKVERIDIAEGKLFLTPPSDWKKMEPRSRIIQYEFRAPKDAKDDDEAARITVMAAGGSVEANIDRWIGQFDDVAKEDAQVEKKEVANQVVHLVEIKGTYKESSGGGPFAPGPMKKFPNYRLLGAIVVTRDAGTIFVKMTGPADLVTKLEEGFKRSIDEMESK